MMFFKPKFNTGCIPDPSDLRDLQYDDMVAGAPEVDWNTGYDVEKDLGLIVNIKDQNGSSSCVGQGWAYYIAILNAFETSFYDETSAKAFYSQIFLPGGGAYIREGGKLSVNWGAVSDLVVSSYDNHKPPSESFMRDISWKNARIDDIARMLQAKEYRVITAADNMNLFAMAIKNNHGVVGGLNGQNNNSWKTGEPKPPAKVEWAHCLYFGKFGIDELGKYIATPNSWGKRKKDALHPDGWQKLREDYFKSKFMFNPWTLVDKANYEMTDASRKVMNENEKKIVIEGEGRGRKGIVINSKLREIKKGREADACLYTLANNNLGITVSSQIFNELEKDNSF